MQGAVTTVHKRRPQTKSGPVRIFFVQGRGGDSSNSDVRTIWCKKLRIFRSLWCVRTDKGVEPVPIFADKRGRRVNISRFCEDAL